MASFSCFQRAFSALAFFLDVRQLFLQRGQPFARVRIVFALQRLALDFELRRPPLQLIDLGRHGVDLDAQRSRGLVNQVDGFVGQKTVGDVAMRQRGRRHNGRVLDADAVMNFVFLAQTAQDGDGVLHVGLADINNLEAALQRGIFLDVLAIFVQRGRANGAQLAARQGGLQHVGSVNRAFRRARAHQRVQLVDEQDDLPLRLLDLFQHRFQAVFEFAAILRARQHRAQVERHHALVLQLLGNVAGNDALRQTFHDRGLADAGLANQHRVVLRPARQHLDHAAHFLVAPDHGIEFALARQLGQVLGVTLQRLVLGLGILVGHLLIAAHRGQPAQNVVVGRARLREDFLGCIALQLGHGQQHVLGGDVLVLEVGRLFEGVLQHLRRGIGEMRLRGAAAGNLRQLLDLAHGLALHRRLHAARRAPTEARRCLRGLPAARPEYVPAAAQDCRARWRDRSPAAWLPASSRLICPNELPW